MSFQFRAGWVGLEGLACVGLRVQALNLGIRVEGRVNGRTGKA